MKKNIILGTIGILILAAMLISFSHFKNRKPINTTKNIVPEQKSKNRKNTNGQATVVWNRKETFTETQGDYEFFAYKSEDKKNSWIYQIKVSKQGTKQELIIPKSIEGSAVTKIGADMSKEEDFEFYQNVFGTYVEACHGGDGSDKYIHNIPAIHMPDTLIEIENSAFSGLDSIRTLILPENLLKIGNDAFYSCDNLQKIYVPEHYEGLCGDSVFRDCLKAEKINVSEKNKKYRTINHMLFSKDGSTLLWVPSSIKKVVIPENTKVIQANAFSYSRVCEVSIPASVEKIEKNAFFECAYVCDINLNTNNKVYKQDGTCIYESDSKRLVLSMVKDHKLTISGQVQIIPNARTVVGGFDKNDRDKIYPSDYPYIERADIPASVTTLEGFWDSFCETNEYSPQRIYFHGMEPPEHIKGDSEAAPMMATTVLYVPAQALNAYKKWYSGGQYKTFIDGKGKRNRDYKYCKSNDCIEITKYIGKEKNVTSPQEIEGLKVSSIGNNAFKNSGIVSVKMPDTILEIKENAFSYCKKLTSAELPNSVTEIAGRAFFGCSSLTTVTLPNAIKVLHRKCFKKCSSLKEIHIPETVESIHLECFSGCTSLENVTMPEHLEEAQGGIFKYCKSLKSIVLPKGLNYLSGELFMGCINLETVDVKGEITGLGFSTFRDCYNLKKLEAVKITETIGFNAFNNCKNLEATIEIMPSCGGIDSDAFYNCPKIKVKNIGNAQYVAPDAFGKN